MIQTKQVAVPHVPAIAYTLGHWIRMIICFCSFGFVYPNAFVEGMDLTAIQRATEGDLYEKT